MGLFSKYNKTNFKSGGCILEGIPMGADTVDTDKKFVAPRKIDYRDMLLPTSNQGQTPHCVGYSTAGMIEFWHWKKEHFPKQFDGDAIYAEAKKLDGNPALNGTWPKYGLQAAKNLGLIDGKAKHVTAPARDIKFILHKYGVFVGGFMITTDWNKVDKKTGFIKYSRNAQKKGGHAVCICGYNEDEGIYIQNSWSTDWGIHGFAILGWEQVYQQFMNGMVIIPSEAYFI